MGEPSEMLDALREPCDGSSMIMKYRQKRWRCDVNTERLPW